MAAYYPPGFPPEELSSIIGSGPLGPASTDPGTAAAPGGAMPGQGQGGAEQQQDSDPSQIINDNLDRMIRARATGDMVEWRRAAATIQQADAASRAFRPATPDRFLAASEAGNVAPGASLRDDAFALAGDVTPRQVAVEPINQNPFRTDDVSRFQPRAPSWFETPVSDTMFDPRFRRQQSYDEYGSYDPHGLAPVGPDPAADLIKSVPRGMAKGLSSVVSGFGEGLAAEADQLGMQSGVPIERPPTPTTEENLAGIEQYVTGPTHQPETRAGRFGETIGEFLGNPLTYLGSGALLPKVARAVAGAIGDETLGQATEGTRLEVPARVLGSIAGGHAVTAAERDMAAAAARTAAKARVQDFVSQQSGRTVDDIHARATVLQDELGAVGKRIEEETGAELIDKGPKKLEAARLKVPRKGYKDAGDLTDLSRISFVVDSPDAAGPIIDRLKRHFEVLDEDWNTGDRGYSDRKLLIRSRGGDGTVGEVQIIPDAMKVAKFDLSGQALYDRWRAMPSGPVRRALVAQEAALYSNARRQLGDAWRILDKSIDPDVPVESARSAAQAFVAAQGRLSPADASEDEVDVPRR